MVLSRLDVNDAQAHPMYHFLKRHSTLYSEKRGKAMPIPWNYSKFLVSPSGVVLSFAGPTVSPLDLEKSIRQAIQSQ